MKCPSCGRDLPPKITVSGNKRQRLVDCLLRHPNGRTVWQLIEYIYSDDPNGGPEKHNIVSVMVKTINRLIAGQGWKIWATGGPGSTYHLRRI